MIEIVRTISDYPDLKVGERMRVVNWLHYGWVAAVRTRHKDDRREAILKPGEFKEIKDASRR